MTATVQRGDLSFLDATVLQRALETERTYFELGAKTVQLPGATLTWTPGFTHAPASSVVHRIDPVAIGRHGSTWLADVENHLTERGVRFARIYVEAHDPRIDHLFRNAGYRCREELVFAHDFPHPPSPLTFRFVQSDEDWARKQAFHEEVTESPDGHANLAADLVGLERHKCAHGMLSFLAEADGKIVGVVGALWGEGLVRVKNLLVHHDHRRQGVGTTLLSHIAALGRGRGIAKQCLVALRGGAGEAVYRSLGMEMVGSQVEWSKALPEPRA